MPPRRKLELDLVAVLLVVAAVELTLNRLAVPVLRPGGSQVPGWHRDIDLVGLFSFHLATALAFAVALVETVGLVASRRSSLPARILVGLSGVVFLGLAGMSVVTQPHPQMSFHLESAFTLFLLCLSLSFTVRPAGARLKIGVVALTIPFLLHYYGTFAVRLILGDDARGSTLPDRMHELGQWSVALASILVALCFAPRPLWRSLLRPGPLALGAFVGTIVAIVLVRHQDVGMEIASRGLGLDVGPTAPTPVLVTFVAAAVATTWALATTLTSEDPGRRLLGMGLALVCVGGYAFAWPLTLLTVGAGVLAIVHGAARVESVPESAGDSAPVIPDAAWHPYTEALAAALGGEVLHEGAVTHVRGRAAGTPFVVTLARGRVPAVDVTLGDVPERAPEVTLQARPQRHLGGRGHPPPPATPAPSVRTGDQLFDDRFRLHEAGGLATRVLDEGLRARASAVLDGWVAVWAGGGLRYHVRPGHGAPLDHPIPLAELAAGTPTRPDRLVHVFHLLAEMAARA
jgi:hypothetical protein